MSMQLCLQAEKYPHRYPYDWRSKQPVIFRATEQWFASVDGFKKEALEAIKGVRWLPPSGHPLGLQNGQQCL